VRRSSSLLALAIVCVASTAGADPYFEEKVAAFGPQACAPEGCWTNYLQIVDLDGDGDLDVVMPNASGFFVKGAESQPLLVYLNDGAGNFTDGSQAMVGGTSGWFRQVAFGDVDGDGKVDMYVPDAWGATDKLFINKGNGTMSDEAPVRLPGVASHAGAARFGDVDNDGDLDLLVGDSWTTAATPFAHLYLNDGSGKLTESSTTLPTAKAGTQAVDFDLLDADGDFDLDLLINFHQGKNSLWINDGKGGFTDAAFPAVGAGSQFHYGPVACDVDGDGDLDVAIDNTGGSYLEQLLVNDGKGKFTDETTARITGNVSGADDNGLACVDVDGDGDFDLAIMSLGANERILVNDGTGHFALTATPAFSVVSDGTLWFDFGDLDGDGKLDAVTGQGETTFVDRFYRGTALAPVDTRAPGFRAVEQVGPKVGAGKKPIVRFAVFDSTTTDTGPRLQKAYVKVTTDQGTTEVPAVFVGGDLFRAELPAQARLGTTVTYATCAKDRRGNDGCAKTKSYTIEGGPSDGGIDDGGLPGSDGGSSSGSSGPGLPPNDGDGGGSGGCGCDVPSASGNAAGALLVIALGALVVARRRRAR
jgi:MYXO-CTERM domain-containing protein